MNKDTICAKCGRKVREVVHSGWDFPLYFWDCSCAVAEAEKERGEEIREQMTHLIEREKSEFSVGSVIPVRHIAGLNDPNMARIAPEVFDILKRWPEDAGKNILSAGLSARGKSFDFAWLLTQLDKFGKFSVADDFAWCSVKSMCDRIISHKEPIYFFGECRVLVLEDIHMAVGGEIGVMHEVADQRANLTNRPIWMTANSTSDRLEEKFPQALINRLFQVDDGADRKPKYLKIVKA